MRVLALSIALLALVALVGCGGGGGSSSGNTGNTGNTGNNGNNGNSGTTKSTGSIAGTAYATKGRIGVFARGTKRTGTQTALGNATVAVSGYSTLTTTTDSSGNFQINNVPTGAQTVVISASGYAMLQRTGNGASESGGHPGHASRGNHGPISMDGAGVSGRR